MVEMLTSFLKVTLVGFAVFCLKHYQKLSRCKVANAPMRQISVVDFTCYCAEIIQDLATQLKLQVAILPDGEINPAVTHFAVVIAPSP